MATWDTAIGDVLLNAQAFYLDHVRCSWVPGYLTARGFEPATLSRWRIGYAPAGWTTLIRRLRDLGHDNAAIQAAGLARRSSRGTLIDHFHDRIMLPLHNEHGRLVGFIGRARPDAGPAVPKYLNSPETVAYTKGAVLFGLHEARSHIARGATPVIVEGPFDAIAVTAAGDGQYAGLSPCGTALTTRQVSALARLTDLRQRGVLLALDGDPAGRRGTIKAYEILIAVTGKLTAAILPPGRDPAQLLQAGGAPALANALSHTSPLARIVIDAHLDRWAGLTDHMEVQLNAMRSAAQLIASLLPPETISQIHHITGGRALATLDDTLHSITHPELPAIARILPAGAICQVIRTADRTNSDYFEITAEVANAISKSTTLIHLHKQSRSLTAQTASRHPAPSARPRRGRA
jgi:DNA primase